MRSMLSLLILVTLSACQSLPADRGGSGGSATTAVPIQGAQTVGGDQGQAQAQETLSNAVDMRPEITNILGAKTVTIQRQADGSETITVEGSEGSIAISGETHMGVEVGELRQDGSSGGGSAGGTGSPQRSSTSDRSTSTAVADPNPDPRPDNQ